MKKLVTTALVLAMALSFAACSKTEPTDTEADTKETTEATTASETEETTAETTEESAPAIPNGYSLVEITSDYLGVKVSYAALDDGRFAGSNIDIGKKANQYGRTEITVNFFEDESKQNSNCVKAIFRIWARSNNYVTDQINRYDAVEGIDYEGIWHSAIGDETKCHYELYTPENSYIDGRIVVEVDMFAYSDWMPLEDYKTLVDTMLQTMTIEILDTNGLNDANGNFPSNSGLFTVPAKVKIAGQELSTYWTVPYSAPHAQIDFTDAQKQQVIILEDGQNVPKYVSARIELDEPDKYREVSFGDYSGICERDTGKGNIEHKYTIVLAQDGEKEKNITFSVIYAAPKTYSNDDIKTMFGDEDKVAEINDMLDAYAEEYLNQLILTVE